MHRVMNVHETVFPLVLARIDDRMLLMKYSINGTDKSCFLNHMTMKLNYDGLLPPVDTHLM